MTLLLQKVSLSFSGKPVVRDVSLALAPGEVVGLLGPNGAGKTTTFNLVTGMLKPDLGDVLLDNNSIKQLSMPERARKGIGYLAQEASIFRNLSVRDNLLLAMQQSGVSPSAQRGRLEELVIDFQLERFFNRKGFQLSGGERRRTEVARALAVGVSGPRFLLLDEPFAGVDPIAVEDIQEIIARLKYKNIGILITDHNVNETLSICDRAYLLIDGKIFKHGTAEELAEDEQVRRLYLGRNFELKRKDYLHLEAAKSNEIKNVSENGPL